MLKPTEPISVIALDDHHLIRNGIKNLLAGSQDVKLVGEGWVGEHLGPLVEERRPDIVLLDINMPQKEGAPVRKFGDESFRAFSAIKQLRRAHPTTRVIIISQYAEPALVEGAIEVGVRGYLLKDDDLSMNLVDAIRIVYAGGLYMSEEVKDQFVNPNSTAGLILTQRQEEALLVLIAHPELPYADLAEQMDISPHTFSNLLRQAYERLDVPNATAAVIRAIRLGIVPIDSFRAAD